MIEPGGFTHAIGILRFHVLDEGFGPIIPNKVHGAPAKTCAGQSCAVAAGLGQGDLDQCIKLRCADFIEISQAFVSLDHQLAKAFDIPRFQHLDGFFHPGNFLNHMPAALPDHLG